MKKIILVSTFLGICLTGPAAAQGVTIELTKPERLVIQSVFMHAKERNNFTKEQRPVIREALKVAIDAAPDVNARKTVRTTLKTMRDAATAGSDEAKAIKATLKASRTVSQNRKATKQIRTDLKTALDTARAGDSTKALRQTLKTTISVSKQGISAKDLKKSLRAQLAAAKAAKNNKDKRAIRAALKVVKGLPTS